MRKHCRIGLSGCSGEVQLPVVQSGMKREESSEDEYEELHFQQNSSPTDDKDKRRPTLLLTIAKSSTKLTGRPLFAGLKESTDGAGANSAGRVSVLVTVTVTALTLGSVAMRRKLCNSYYNSETSATSELLQIEQRLLVLQKQVQDLRAIADRSLVAAGLVSVGPHVLCMTHTRVCSVALLPFACTLASKHDSVLNRDYSGERLCSTGSCIKMSH